MNALRARIFAGKGFSLSPLPARVVFGAGALDRLPELVSELGAQRVLVIASTGRAALVQRVSALLGARHAGTDTRAVMHVPVALAEEVGEHGRSLGADLTIAVGGGSAIGMAKAVTLAGGPLSIAIPTTYSGSEMTPIWGLTRGGAKETGRDERVRPRAVLYDPALTLDLPPRISGPSALNAVAHAIEALYAPDVNPVVALLAADALRALSTSIPRVVRAPSDLEARTSALYGAWLAGLALGASTMGLHHKLSHVLGGSFGLPHAETHAILLPHTIAYNAPAAPAAMQVVAESIGSNGQTLALDEVPNALRALATSVSTRAGAPTSLRDLGFRQADIPFAVSLATLKPYPNPREVTASAVREILERALGG
jgi:maleylacetate reductase